MRTRALLLAAAFLLAGTVAAGAQKPGERPRGDQRDGPLRLLSYGDVFQENYTDVVLKPFTASRGIPVEFVPGDTSVSMLDRLRAEKDHPQIDVVIMDSSAAATACAEGLVEPVNPRILPVLKDLYDSAQAAGGACGPGVTFDHLVIVYDSAKVTPPPVSLRALWNPAWRGRIAISAPPNIQGLALTALLANADSADWRQADAAFRELRELAPSVKTFDPQPDGYTLVLNGTVTFATGWNARAQLYRDHSAGRLGVMLPDEGTVFQINTINVVRNAPHRDQGFALLASALAPPAQKAFSERMFYAPTNPMAHVDAEAEERTAASPFNMAKVVPVDWREMARLSEAWTQRWRKEVIGASAR